MKSLALFTLTVLTIGCSSDSPAPNSLTDAEIAAEAEKHRQRIEEFNNRSIERIVQAKGDMRRLDSDMDDLQGSAFEHSRETRHAIDSLSRFKHSSDVAKMTVEMYDQLKELRDLEAANPRTDVFSDLIIQLEAAIDHNQQFIDSIDGQ